MDIESKRKHFLSLLAKPVREINSFSESYRGSRLKKILKYRAKYILYGLARIGLLPKMKNKTATFWGKKMQTILGDDLILYLFGVTAGGLEYKLVKFLIKNLKQNDVFYDIGANYGFYALLAGEFIDNGEIHAFEPSPTIFDCMRKNCPDEKFVLNKLALSYREGVADFYDYSEYGSGVSTTVDSVADAIATSSRGSFKKIGVNTTTLDHYAASHKRPTIIKMDVEGGEGNVVDGGLKLLREANPVIVMEVWAGEAGEKHSMNAVKKLWALGYKSYKIDEEGDLRSIADHLTDIKDGGDNYVFKKQNNGQSR